MTPRNISSSVGVAAVALFIGLGIQYALAQWSAAPSSPPSGNVSAPINVGTGFQSKAGALQLLGQGVANGTSTLDVEGVGYMSGLIVRNLQVLSGTVASGSVLTSDGSGDATWQAASLTSGAHGSQLYSTPGTYTWTVPSGVTTVVAQAIGGGGGSSSGTTCAVEGGLHPVETAYPPAAGGSGGFGESAIAVTPGQSISVTVGAGGGAGDVNIGANTGGIGGWENGSNGGNSLFGSTVEGYGGTGGSVGDEAEACSDDLPSSANGTGVGQLTNVGGYVTYNIGGNVYDYYTANYGIGGTGSVNPNGGSPGVGAPVEANGNNGAVIVMY